MKSLLALGIFLSLQAVAAEKNAVPVCGSLMNCGTFSEAVEKDGEIVTTTIAIAETGENTASLSFKRSSGSENDVWELQLTFEEGGNFVGKAGSRLYATGICGKDLCTFSLVPMENEMQKYGIVGVIRFTPNSLEYNRFSAGDMGQFSSQNLLIKQP